MFLNLFTSDLLLVLPGIFMILNLLVLIIYSVFSSTRSFSRYLVEDVIVSVSFVLLLTIVLFVNQPSKS